MDHQQRVLPVPGDYASPRHGGTRPLGLLGLLAESGEGGWGLSHRVGRVKKTSSGRKGFLSGRKWAFLTYFWQIVKQNFLFPFYCTWNFFAKFKCSLFVLLVLQCATPLSFKLIQAPLCPLCALVQAQCRLRQVAPVSMLAGCVGPAQWQSRWDEQISSGRCLYTTVTRIYDNSS